MTPSLGVGIDVVEIARIRRAAARSRGFLSRVFTMKELSFARRRADPYPHLAAAFAVKEACAKALGEVGRGWAWHDFEVRHARGGAPTVTVSARLRRRLRPAPRELRISLTHEGDRAAAVAVALF